MAKFIIHCLLAAFTIVPIIAAINEGFYKALPGSIFFGIIWIVFSYFTIPIFREVVEDKVGQQHDRTSLSKDQQLKQETQQPFEQARQKQLAALREAVPKSVPERMRATVQINECKQMQYEQRRVPHLIGEDSWESYPKGPRTMYAVDMILEMSETERAIIKQHQLDDVMLEDVAAYSEHELVTTRVESRERTKALKDPLRKEIAKVMDQNVSEMMKEERNRTRVGDLLVSPFTRLFDTPHEANDYANKLKTKFLPRIRELIEQYRTHKQTDTIEF